MGAYIALPASMLCICRYLAQVSSPRHTVADMTENRRRKLFELGMCFGLPVLGMALRKCYMPIVRIRMLILICRCRLCGPGTPL
jgi:hypothetical protein